MIYFDALNMKEMGGLKYLELIHKFTKSDKNIKFIVRESILQKFSFHDPDKLLILKDKTLGSFIISYIKIQLDIFNKKANLVGMSGYTPFLCQKLFIIYQNEIPFNIKVIKKYNFKHRVKFVLLRFLLEFNYLRASKIVFLTYGSFRHISKSLLMKYFFSKKKLKVIYHGLETNIKPTVLNKFSMINNRLDVVYISSYQPYKNHDEVIDFFDYISKSIDVRLHFFGGYIKGADGYTKKLRTKINDSKDLIDYGFLETTNIFKTVPKNSIFIFNSSCETFGQIVLEVARSGFPIFVSRESNAFEIMPKNYKLFFDPKITKDNIHRFINLVNQKEIIYEASKDLVKHSYNFDAQKLTKKLINFLY